MRPNTTRELLRAISLGKRIITIYDTDHAHYREDDLRDAIETGQQHYHDWRIDQDLTEWGVPTPSVEDIFKALTTHTLVWSRIPAFLFVTLRACVEPLIEMRSGREDSRRLVRPPTANLREVTNWQDFWVSLLKSLNFNCRRRNQHVSSEALQRRLAFLSSSRMYIQTGVSIDWVPANAVKRFHLFVSSNNHGALKLVQEVGDLIKPLALSLSVTTNIAELQSCQHMLLYLDRRTWTSGKFSAVLEEEVRIAMQLGIHVLLAHETEPIVLRLSASGPQHHGVHFEELIDCVDGATPVGLLRQNIYDDIAVPLKEGIYRPESLLLVAKAISQAPRATEPPARVLQHGVNALQEFQARTAAALCISRASCFAEFALVPPPPLTAPAQWLSVSQSVKGGHLHRTDRATNRRTVVPRSLQSKSHPCMAEFSIEQEFSIAQESSMHGCINEGATSRQEKAVTQAQVSRDVESEKQGLSAHLHADYLQPVALPSARRPHIDGERSIHKLQKSRPFSFALDGNQDRDRDNAMLGSKLEA